MSASDERVRAILGGRRAIRIYPLPGAPDDSDLKIGVRVLTGEEIDEAKTEAVQYTQALAQRRKLDAQQLQWIDGDPHQAEVQRQLIYRACFEPTEGAAEPKRFFASVTAVRQIDDSFAQMLYQLYLGHQQWVNPYLGLSKSEIDELVETLKKTPERKALLGLYDVRTLLTLADTLVDRLAS